jgi:hypothetical protein
LALSIAVGVSSSLHVLVVAGGGTVIVDHKEVNVLCVLLLLFAAKKGESKVL